MLGHPHDEGARVARAKRTDRAQARRRHRASLTDAESQGGGAPESSPAEAPASGRSRPRPGFLSLFTTAIRPVDIRGDVAYLPTLVLRTKAVWVPGLLTAIAGVIALVPGGVSSGLGPIIALFVLQTPLAGPFLAGVLAPRASWLAGLIVGLEAAIFTTLYVFTAPLPAGAELTASQLVTVVLFNFFVVFPLFGMFVASFAAFYRRFLRNSNQAAAARRAQSSSGRRGSQRPQPRPSTARALRRR
jgi:hypothetical protein